MKVSDVPEEHKRDVETTQQSQFVTFTKQGEKFRVEKRTEDNKLEADFSACFDGKVFYSFMKSQGLLQVGSLPAVFEKELINCLVLSPFTFGSLSGFSDEDHTRIAAELLKKEDLASLACAYNSGEAWCDLSWKFNRNLLPQSLFPAEIIIKFYNSKENYDKGLVSNASTRRIRTLEVSLGGEKKSNEFFVIPASKARSLVDYDVSDEEIILK